ncbi:MAG: hypothetical protein FJ091_19135 [Deltaproteobacteria bacterium]|nr:hypothetical protein [Deltaproteobacteria bacterium]
MTSARNKWPRRLAALALTIALASAASARSELLRWQHADPTTVAGFKVYVGNAAGSYQTTLDVGMPTASNGVFSYSLQVPDANTVFVVVSAYGPTGLEGTKSNEKRLLGLLGTPGKPQVSP